MATRTDIRPTTTPGPARGLSNGYSTTSEEGLVPLVKRMMDGLEHLVSAHLELVRLELKQDAKKLLLQVAKVAAFFPLFLAGLVVLVGGAGVLVGTQIGLWQGLMLVGGGVLVLSGLGLWLVIRSLRAPKLLDDTRAEVSQTAAQLKEDAKQLASSQDHPEGPHVGH